MAVLTFDALLELKEACKAGKVWVSYHNGKQQAKYQLVADDAYSASGGEALVITCCPEEVWESECK